MFSVHEQGVHNNLGTPAVVGHLSCNHSKQIFGSISAGDESPCPTAKHYRRKIYTEKAEPGEKTPALGFGSPTSLLNHQVLTLAMTLHPHGPTCKVKSYIR